MQALLQTLPHLKTAKAGLCQSDGATPGHRTQCAVDCVVELPVANLARAGRSSSIQSVKCAVMDCLGKLVRQGGAPSGGEC